MSFGNPRLMSCPDCSKPVSKRARICPGCGRPHPGGRSWGKVILAVVIVAAVIGILAALLIPALHNARLKALQVKTKANAHAISIAIKSYYADNRKYPASLTELVIKPKGAKKWNGPYMKNLPKDAWGHNFVYQKRFKGKGMVVIKIISYGADGKPGGKGADRDIVVK